MRTLMVTMIITVNSDREAWSIPFPGHHDDIGDDDDSNDYEKLDRLKTCLDIRIYLHLC